MEAGGEAVNAYLSEGERALLERARVGIAGAGGLGSNCAMHLVRAGVKRFSIADFDVVSEANLNRQFYFRRQIGLAKTRALAENLRAIEPELDIRWHDGRIDVGNALEVFSGCDVVVEAFDAVDAKKMIIDVFAKTGVPVVAAIGIAGWGRSGEIGLRRAGKRLYVAGDCKTAVGPGSGPQSPRVGIAAAIQANTVVSLILGREP